HRLTALSGIGPFARDDRSATRETWRSGSTPSLANELLELAPVRLAAEPGGDPAGFALVRWDEEAVGGGFDQHRLCLEVTLEPDGERVVVVDVHTVGHANIFPATRQVCSPQATFSDVSGRARQSLRSLASSRFTRGFLRSRPPVRAWVRCGRV